MDITDAMRRVLFEQTFGVTAADAVARAGFLRRVGVPEGQIAALCRPGLHAGMALGGAHGIDVQFVVEHVLLRQKAGSVTLRVEHDRNVEGHLRIVVVEVGPTGFAVESTSGEEPTP